MKSFLMLVLFLIVDVASYYSVPREVRLENKWSLTPGAGYILAAEYHFGNKLDSPRKERHD